MANDIQIEGGGISPEEEIRVLEQKLEAKKKELLAQKGEAAIPSEKEIFREVLKSHIEAIRPTPPKSSAQASSQPQPASALADDQKKKIDEIQKKEEREEEVRALIEYALTRGVENAVRVAQKATPYLLDELHDHLADEYYDKLLALRKVSAL